MWRNIFFWFVWLGMCVVLAVGTVGVFKADIPIWAIVLLEILLIWCDLVAIVAAVNRIKNMFSGNDKEKHICR